MVIWEGRPKLSIIGHDRYLFFHSFTQFNHMNDKLISYHEYSCTLILLSYLLAAMKGPETSPIMLALVTVAQIIRRNPATSGPVSQSPVEKMPMYRPNVIP